MPKNVWINNSRVGRYLADILGNQSEKLAFAVSKLISVVVPLELLAFEPQTIEVPATAGNAVVTISPKKGHRMVFIRGRITLVCSADVANRQIYIDLLDANGNIVENLGATGNLTASSTHWLSLGEGRWVQLASLGQGEYYIATEPIEVVNADSLRVSISAGVAGDSFSGRFWVKWM